MSSIFSYFTGIKHWDLIVMLALMAALTTFEMIGVFSPRLVTITQIIKTFVPMPLRIMCVAWIAWHFVASDLVRAIQTGTPVK